MTNYFFEIITSLNSASPTIAFPRILYYATIYLLNTSLQIIRRRMAGNFAGGINAADPPHLQPLPAAPIAANYRELPFYLPLTCHSLTFTDYDVLFFPQRLIS